MPTYYRNAENALNRANEFCELGKDHEALDCLYDVLKNRKSKIVIEIHEKIINKFLELCVELRKSQLAKDGLYIYRNVCQQVNLKSWEDAIRKYLDLAQSKVESAQKTFQSIVLDVDYLDQDMTPEILLKAVSSEGAEDRSERIILLPWIKFLWECHKHCLDLLRTPQTEKLYHVVAQNAFKFCVKYSRKSELRKLCSILRIYVTFVQKRQTYLKADDSETQLMCLETGFIELDSAINMELWQDAFKAVEDIHSIINISKKFQQSRIMARYYDKFSCVLWKGEEYLFHAAAILRYFQILKDQKKNLSLEDITKLACRAFLSILAVPLASSNPTSDLVAETDMSVLDKNHLILSSLLYLQKCPTRNSLIKDAIAQGITQYLPTEFKELFQAVEYDLNPTKLHHYISAAAQYIENSKDSDLRQYMPLIHKGAVVKLIPVLFDMYISIKMSKLQYFTGISQVSDLEIILVDSARKYEYPLRIDHRNMCVHFSSHFNIFQNERFRDESETENHSHNRQLKCLVQTYNGLKSEVAKIYPERLKDENTLIAETISRRYKRKEEFYRKKILLRKTTIEKYKERIENLRIQREEEERKLLADKLLQHEIAEKERLLRETEERNLQRLRREQEEIKRKILLNNMENFKKLVLGSQLSESVELDDLNNLDPQILFSKQIQQLNKEKKELSSKLRRQERSFSHIERAKRIEEIPLLEQEYGFYKENHFKTWKEDQTNKLDTAHRIRVEEVYKKKRFLEMKSDLENFFKMIKKRRLDAYYAEAKEFLKTLEVEKQKRLKDRAERRKEARRNEWNKQQELRRKENLMRFNKEDACSSENIKAKYKRQVMKESIHDQTSKSSLSPKTPPSSHRGREFHFAESINSCDAGSLYENSRKRDFLSAGNYEGTDIAKDTYYYSRTYKSRMEKMEGTESFECKASVSKFFSNLYSSSKRDIHKPNYYCTRGKPTLFEKREETEFAGRTPSSSSSNYSFSHTGQNQRFVKEEVLPEPKKYTIIQRKETRSEQYYGQSNKDSENESQKLIKKEAEHSCTPWAKLKRKAFDS